MKSNQKSAWLEAIQQEQTKHRKPKPEGFLSSTELGAMLGVTPDRAAVIARRLFKAGRVKQDWYQPNNKKAFCWKLL